MQIATPVNLFWFRRDLRLTDNAGLFNALKDKNPVIPIFIFDSIILDELEDKKDNRVNFIFECMQSIQNKLIEMGTTLDVRYGEPLEVLKKLVKDYNIEKIFTNHDYEPYATDRDGLVSAFLKDQSIIFTSFKDQVIFEKKEVLKKDNSPYTVFTPYSRLWKEKLDTFYLSSYPDKKYYFNFYKQSPKSLPTLSSIGFKKAGIVFPSSNLDESKIINYQQNRNYPGVDGTTHASVHLRFGTISIRKLAHEAKKLSETYLNELIWREFYQMILWHHPQVVHQSFKPQYDNIIWRNNEKEFEAWCKGFTGYPIVDAGMRQLNASGFMHNRVRMIVASFLTKHLLIDWRWGEAYFAKKLLDYELASNNGGWQWAAGSGVDAAPYFRIFNPYLQTKKFDPELKYIRQWVPELDELTYPLPVVDHDYARKRCLEVYGNALKKG